MRTFIKLFVMTIGLIISPLVITFSWLTDPDEDTWNNHYAEFFKKWESIL